MEDFEKCHYITSSVLVDIGQRVVFDDCRGCGWIERPIFTLKLEVTRQTFSARKVPSEFLDAIQSCWELRKEHKKPPWHGMENV